MDKRSYGTSSAAEICTLRAEVARLAKWQARAEYLMTENPNAHASEILALLKLEH